MREERVRKKKKKRKMAGVITRGSFYEPKTDNTDLSPSLWTVLSCAFRDSISQTIHMANKLHDHHVHNRTRSRIYTQIYVRTSLAPLQRNTRAWDKAGKNTLPDSLRSRRRSVVNITSLFCKRDWVTKSREPLRPKLSKHLTTYFSLLINLFSSFLVCATPNYLFLSHSLFLPLSCLEKESEKREREIKCGLGENVFSTYVERGRFLAGIKFKRVVRRK